LLISTPPTDTSPTTPPAVTPAGPNDQVDKCPGGNKANDQKANRARHLDGDGKECSQGPRQLKLRFKLREGSTLVGTRSIALHDALETEPSDGRDHVQGAGQNHRAHRAPERRCADTGNGCDDQRRDQHCFFAHSVTQARRDRVAHHGNKG